MLPDKLCPACGHDREPQPVLDPVNFLRRLFRMTPKPTMCGTEPELSTEWPEAQCPCRHLAHSTN